MDPKLYQFIMNQLSDGPVDSAELERIRQQLATSQDMRDALQEVLGAIVDENLKRKELYEQDRRDRHLYQEVQRELANLDEQAALVPIVDGDHLRVQTPAEGKVEVGSNEALIKNPNESPWRRWGTLLKPYAAAAVVLAVAALTSGLVSNSWSRSSYAHENNQLRHVLDEQRAAQMHIAELLKAVSFLNDDVSRDQQGPSIMVSGRNGLTVAGVANPKLIEKVEVNWDLDQEGEAPEEIFRQRLVRADALRSQAAVPFEQRHVYSLKPGQKVRVRVVASGVEAERATLSAMKRDENWCTREATFVMTDYGLCPYSNSVWLDPGIEAHQTIDRDTLLLKGAVYESGWLVAFLRTVDGEFYWLDKPVAVESGKPVLREFDFGDCPDGHGTILLQLFDSLPADWQRITCSRFASPELNLPSAKHQVEIPVEVKLPPTAIRVARFVKEFNGTAKLQFEEKNADLETIQMDSRIQHIDLSFSRVSSIQRLRTFPSVQGLKLDGTLMTDEGLEGLDRLSEVMWLGLSETKVTDAAIVKSVPALTKLEGLMVCQNRGITNKTLESLARTSRTLRTLDISDTSVTSVRSLVELPNLTWLRIRGLTIPAEEIDELKRKIPKPKIVTD